MRGGVFIFIQFVLLNKENTMKYLILFIVIPLNLFSQNPAVFFSESEVQIPKGKVGEPVLDTVFIVNNSGSSLLIHGIISAENPINIEVLSYKDEIQDGDSSEVILSITALTAFRETDPLIAIVEYNNNEFEILCKLHSDFDFQEPYYASLKNLEGVAFYDELQRIISDGFFSLGYKEARRKMWGEIWNEGGFVECAYTGRTVKTDDIPDVNITHFNTEHTWPRSFGAEIEPMKSDLFHILPTWENANTTREDFPFDDVNSTTFWEDGGSQLGEHIEAGKNRTVFQVREVHKGDVARGIMYYAIRYGNQGKYIRTGYQHEDALRFWNYEDLPDNREKNRNELIFNYQKNRNPFIDYPTLANMILDFSERKDIDLTPFLHTPETIRFFFDEGMEMEKELNAILYNNSRSEVIVSSLEITGNDANFFQLLNKQNEFTIQPEEFVNIGIKSINTNVQYISAKLVIQTLGNPYEIELSATSTTDIEKEKSSSIRIFPNPVNDFAKIEFDYSISLPIILEFYDLQGSFLLSENVFNNIYKLDVIQLRQFGKVIACRFNNGRLTETKFIFFD